MNVARLFPAVAELGERICVAGGFDEYAEFINSVEIYDPKKDEWTPLPPMKNQFSGSTIFKWNESLYAMGDRSERFDPWEQTWTEVIAPNKTKDLQNS